MLHSVMPPEVIWWEAEGVPPATAPEVVAEGPRRIWLRRDAAGRRRVERIASTAPSDYLDPRLQPGALWQGPATAMRQEPVPRVIR
jgi:hypothetical protein